MNMISAGHSHQLDNFESVNEKSSYTVIGVMSGTSLDGLDIACCTFRNEGSKWQYEIHCAVTVPYDQTWITRLTHLHTQPTVAYPRTDVFYGKFIGIEVGKFIKHHHLKPDLIASHGHTIFHEPELGYTAQVGHGAAIHAETNIPVVSDFRTLDVMLGGQGAPLVPLGDALLFGEYDACINLGGFANISMDQNGKRIAYDITPCNVLLNNIAQHLGATYDKGGEWAAQGTVNTALMEALQDLDYFRKVPPKSLGIEWVHRELEPIFREFHIDPRDMLATLNAFIAAEVCRSIERSNARRVFITGGGSYNNHLINRIRNSTSAEIIIPEPQLIEYKEALIFAFLGLLRALGKENALSSVTGSVRNSVGGSLWGCF